MIFGYTKRQDYRDTRGYLWRPATEIVTRLAKREDTVARCWMIETKNIITNTPDPDLYRFGYHAKDFWVNITVGPGKYTVRLKFAANQDTPQYKNGFDIIINKQIVKHNFNVIDTAGGVNKGVDLVFQNIVPSEGIIQIRFKGLPFPDSDSTEIGDAFVQALEIDKHITD
jgi:hypothetical protein